jgi:hypothetical protein
MKMGWLKREAVVEGGAIEDEETQVYIIHFDTCLPSYPQLGNVTPHPLVESIGIVL